MTDIHSTRQLISQQAKLDCIENRNTWFLLGTMGCHLCDEAENMLRLFSSVSPVVIEKIDIIDFDEAFLAQYASVIPVIITKSQQLNYPFSVVDLQRVYQNELL
ncbi:glutaredoxin family protein [Psychrobacter sp.]|uniref:glutaredoxin family protein n=1 Tax=Psychrobacter sp. TaxID=56811 RepID=UPI0025ECDC82|nr:glutaredoxin family protein [Psychrobacter sp.]